MIDAILFSFIAGVGGTGLGGLLVIALKRPKAALLSTMLGFAAGIMLAVITLELMPEAVAASGESNMLSGFMIGIIVMLLGDLLIGHLHMTERDQGLDMKKNKLNKTGWFLTVGIALHNLPEGLAIGMGMAADRTFGLVIATMIMMQNIPEGVAVAAPTYACGKTRTKTLFQAFLAGVPMPIGAAVGFLIGNMSDVILGSGLGFAAGAMFFITCDELIPEAHMATEKFGHLPILSIVMGFIIGILLSLIS